MSPAEPGPAPTSPTTPGWLPPASGGTAPNGGNRLAVVLSAVAVILAGAALGVGLTGHAGSTGSAGATGPSGTPGSPGSVGARGPAGTNGSQGLPGAAGPGAVVVEAHPQYAITMSSACGPYIGTAVNFTVSRPGVIVVTAVIGVEITKTANGTTNYSGAVVNLSNQTGDCISLAQVFVEFGPVPNGYYYGTITLVRSWNVTAPGNYSFSVNGYNEGPANGSTDFASTTVVGVYYPS
jgi:hypothetical protein